MAGLPDFSQQCPMISKQLAVDMQTGKLAVDPWSQVRNPEPAATMMRPTLFPNMGRSMPKTVDAAFWFQDSQNAPKSTGHLFQMQRQLVANKPEANPTPVENGIGIKLENAPLWHEFAQHTTEMVITKLGRRMFPTLRFHVSGLDPASTYGFYMVFTPVDNFRYKFQHCKWSVSGQCESPTLPHSIATYQHPDSPAPGRTWMSQPLSFHRIKLTNCMKSSGDMVVLSSMRKYQPRLVVVKLHENFNGHPLRIVAEFSPPETQFIAVTAYQNSHITNLKVQHNPFAKGFRQTMSATVLDQSQESQGEVVCSKSETDGNEARDRKRKASSATPTSEPSEKRSASEQRAMALVPASTAADKSPKPVYGSGQQSNFQWPPVSTPEMQVLFLASEMAKSAAVKAIGAANDAGGGYYSQINAAPTFSIMNHPAPNWFSPLVSPPRPYPGLLNPITASNTGLPRIGVLWAGMPRTSSALPESSSGMRFSMY